MHRRHMLASAMASLSGLFAVAAAPRRAQAAASLPDKSKVVYHLADLDKVSFVLGNIRNHYEGVGGPDRVTIALVIHGPALKAFHAASASRDVMHHVRDFAREGLALNACGNTMRGQHVTLNDLLPGFTVAERGGVVRLAELQAQGYVYIRP